MRISSVLEDFANFLMIHIICNGRMGLTISRISFFSPILKKSAETVNGIPVNLRKMDSENWCLPQMANLIFLAKRIIFKTHLSQEFGLFASFISIFPPNFYFPLQRRIWWMQTWNCPQKCKTAKKCFLRKIIEIGNSIRWTRKFCHYLMVKNEIERFSCVCETKGRAYLLSFA